MNKKISVSDEVLKVLTDLSLKRNQSLEETLKQCVSTESHVDGLIGDGYTILRVDLDTNIARKLKFLFQNK